MAKDLDDANRKTSSESSLYTRPIFRGWVDGGVDRGTGGGGRKRSDSPTCRTYLASVVTKAEVLNQSFWSVCFEKSLCFWMQQICGGFAEVLHLCFPD